MEIHLERENNISNFFKSEFVLRNNYEGTAINRSDVLLGILFRRSY